MSRSESEEGTKNRPYDYEPLCAFYFKTAKPSGKSEYIPPPQRQKLQHRRNFHPKKLTAGAQKRIVPTSDETDSRGQSQRTKKYQDRSWTRRLSRNKKVHHLTSYLLSSVNDIEIQGDSELPSLKDVLNTIQDAWPTSKPNESDRKDECTNPTAKPHVEHAQQQAGNFIRRRSVPEEIIRKFSVSKDRTSESETNNTMPEAASASSKDADSTERINSLTKEERVAKYKNKFQNPAFTQTIREEEFISKKTPVKSFAISPNDPVYSAEEGSSDSDSDAPGLERFNTIKRAPLRRGSVMDQQQLPETVMTRVSQSDYYKNGQGILQERVKDKSLQTDERSYEGRDSETTASAPEESESAESNSSLSSPTLCTKPLTSSDNLSSDSEGIHCTCAELTSSKDTSTDPNHSGKSTLSQTRSDNSESTQDSTMSVKSVPSEGSSISAASSASTPEIDPKTSAKETTTSPDNTPRTDNINNRHRKGGDGGGNGFNQRLQSRKPGEKRENTSSKRNSNQRQYNQTYHESGRQRKEFSTCGNQVPSFSERDPKIFPIGEVGTAERYSTSMEKTILNDKNDDFSRDGQKSNFVFLNNLKTETKETVSDPSKRKEYLSQQLKIRSINGKQEETSKIMSQPSLELGAKVGICTGVGTIYRDPSAINEKPITVPRYSALPRTLSMVVNTSSFEAGQNSDSESLADSLEEGENRKIHYYDTKHESKPVRGDVTQVLEKKTVRNKSRGRAYFVSLEKDEKAPEVVSSVHRIPEPPDKIKEKIYKRHVNICKSHRTKEQIEESSKNLPNPYKPNKIKRRKRTTKVAVKETGEPTTVRNPLKKDKPIWTDTGHLQQHDASSCQRTALDKEEKSNTEKPVGQEKISLTNISQIPIFTKKLNQHECEVIARKDVAEGGQIVEKEMKPMEQKIKSEEKKESTVDLASFNKHRLSLISSLESTASYLKQQQPPMVQQKQWNRQQITPKRPHNLKFQQRFEVIPEERSSSLTSSAEDRSPEKDRRRSLPVKLREDATNPSFLDQKSFRRYSLESLSNYVIAKLMGKPLQAIPCVRRGPNNENQQIIVFSPKDATGNNSAKGRDALLAMNREDFVRLSKGWMNFYLLKENSDNEKEMFDEVKEESEANENYTSSTVDGEMKVEAESNTIVCRIPSMERDLKTSDSGTDETCSSPSHSLNVTDLKKCFGLQMKEIGNDYFQLEQCPLNELDGENTRPENEQRRNPKQHDLAAKTAINPMNINVEEQKEIKDKENIDYKPNHNHRQGSCKTNVPTNDNASSSTTSDDGTKSNEPSAFAAASKKETKDSRETKLETGIPPGKKHKAKCKKNEENSAKAKELSEDVKLSSSNTVLRTIKKIVSSPKKTPKSSDRQLSLPQLRADGQVSYNTKQSSGVHLPKIQGLSGSDDIDSDSTSYMRAPSPQVPRLPLESCCDGQSDDSYSSSTGSDANDTRPAKGNGKVNRCNQGQFQRERSREQTRETKSSNWKRNSGWSVTVAGTVDFPSSTPDLQMRLSFPAGNGRPVVSQSDSGFHESRPHRGRPQKTQWTVTVQNPKTGITREKHKASCQLPKLKHTAEIRDGSDAKLVLTRSPNDKKMIVEKLTRMWPQVKALIEKTLTTDTVADGTVSKSPQLLVSGRAASLDEKPRVLKMSERDLTRNNTARSETTKTKA